MKRGKEIKNLEVDPSVQGFNLCCCYWPIALGSRSKASSCQSTIFFLIIIHIAAETEIISIFSLPN